MIWSFVFILFKPILLSTTLHYHSHFKIFNFLIDNPFLWNTTKIVFVISYIFSLLILLNLIFSLFHKKSTFYCNKNKAPVFGLYVGNNQNNNKVYIPEAGLYQNILVTGTIGSGKTSSALYPFTKQLINYKCYDSLSKLSFLVLDVKGNYYSKVLDFAKSCGRLNDVIVIELNGKYSYNPLDKPYLKSSVLANRLKEILLLFSPNNSESYWVDKAEQILEACINFCRIYNDGYVSFDEIHNLVTDLNYYKEKINQARMTFISGKLSKDDIFNLYSSISFLEKDYFSLDTRTLNILKSEITRITNCFVSSLDVKNTFCPHKNHNNFFGFDSVLKKGKIVVLNMNIAEYKNLSKIIAAYLKLDFQTDILKQLSNNKTIVRPSVFISDEYQEYATISDAAFFSQSRESKCINIVATQSYTSLLNSLNNQNASKVIIQSLVNKFWFRSDDIYTIEDIQKQIGKEEKEKISKSFSENPKESVYNPILKNFVSVGSNISESVNSYTQLDYSYDYQFFTQELSTFQCLAFLSDGSKIEKPQKLKMIPYFKN